MSTDSTATPPAFTDPIILARFRRHSRRAASAELRAELDNNISLPRLDLRIFEGERATSKFVRFFGASELLQLKDALAEALRITLDDRDVSPQA